MIIDINFYDNAPEYGAQGTWTRGKESGEFGRSLKGMWANLTGSVFGGIETYETCVNSKFLDSLERWRKLNNKFKRYKA